KSISVCLEQIINSKKKYSTTDVMFNSFIKIQLDELFVKIKLLPEYTKSILLNQFQKEIESFSQDKWIEAQKNIESKRGWIEQIINKAETLLDIVKNLISDHLKHEKR